MYLYLGQDTVIRTDEIIGIFDLESASTGRLTKAYLAAAQKSGRVVEVSPEIPRSFAVCGKRNGQTVYLSQISTATLEKRSHYFEELSNL